jgi:hypothetical protein
VWQVLKNRVLRGIHGAKRWRNLHNEALHNIYSSSNIIRMIKSRRMRCGMMWSELKCVQNFGWKI